MKRKMSAYLNDAFIVNVLVDDSLMYLDHSIGLWLENRDISDALRFATGVRRSYHVFAGIFFTDCNRRKEFSKNIKL